MRVKYNASLIEAKDREEAEQLRQLQADNHAGLMKLKGPTSRGSQVQTQAEGEPLSLSSKTSDQSTPGQTSNPWAAADAPVETQSWTPTLRRRSE